MKRIMLVVGIAALAACNQTEAPPPADTDSNVAIAETETATAPMSLNETSWTFTQDGKPMQESIDANGNYIANSGDEHVDHGTMAMVDGKACFTSAMNQEGPECWTVDKDVAVGESIETRSDKGKTLTVTRQEYTPLTMPS